MTAKEIYIEDMTIEQKKSVWANNEKLRTMVLDDAQDSEMYWIGEKLDYIKDSLSNWSIGTCSHCLISVNTSSIKKFLEGMKKMNEEVPAFGDEDAERILSELEKKIEIYHNADCELENYEELEEAAENQAQEAADELAAQFEKDLNYLYSDENLISYFLEFYSTDARMNKGEFYIIEGDEKFLLQKEVRYTQSFK